MKQDLVPPLARSAVSTSQKELCLHSTILSLGSFRCCSELARRAIWLVLASGLLIGGAPARAQDAIQAPAGAGDAILGSGGTAGTGLGGQLPIPPGTTIPGSNPFSTSSTTAFDALEGAVDGGYTLGPGDRLGIYLWGDPPISFDTRVTLEGKVVLPQVGEADVLGKDLKAAEAEIARLLARRYRNQRVTLALLQLRRFQVHVTGQVELPGGVLASAADRVLDAIALAGGSLDGAGLRRVLIKGANGTDRRADIFRYLRTGEIESNPPLRDGDIVVVPYRGPQVFLYGAVSEPGGYEFLENDTLAELVQLAGGMTEDADPDSVEVTRFVDGVRTERFYLSFQGREELEAASDFVLREGDQVQIRRNLNWHRRQIVEVRGEVKFPGTFPIVDGETRLSEVIERAGGFTDLAFLPEATVIRRRAIRLDDKEYERLQKMSSSEMTDDEYEYYKMKSREQKGLMVVDFVGLFDEGKADQDLLLRSGDAIEVPAKKDFVSVLGEVSEPGNVYYRPLLGIDAYIDLAGGFSSNADKGKVRVIRVATGEWVEKDKVGLLEAGDTIWVPEKPDRDYWRYFQETLGVVTQILTVYLIVDRATN
ncbi:MAG: SLBB domain-containing protein [Candidatus Eisenbacteria bacterium]